MVQKQNPAHNTPLYLIYRVKWGETPLWESCRIVEFVDKKAF